MPKNFALSGRSSREFFNKNGDLQRIEARKENSIQHQLVKEFKWKEKDAQDV